MAEDLNTMDTKAKTFFILLIMILGGAFSVSYAEGKGADSVSVMSRPAGDTVRMSLKECVDYAVEHSYKMMIQLLANDDRRLDERDAYLSFLPSISASIAGQASFGRNIDPETNIYTTTTSFSNSYGISGGMYVFNGFKIVNNYKIAKTARALGYEETQQLKDEIALAVIQAYYNVLYNEKMLALTRAQLEASQANLELVAKEYELGRKSLADKSDIEAEVAEYSYNLVKQRNALESSYITLREAMQYPYSEPLAIETDTSDDASISLMADKESIVSTAKDRLPSARIAEYNIKTAKASFNSAKWSLLPSISLSGGYSTGYNALAGAGSSNAPFWTQMKNLQGQYVGVSISIPVFNGLYQQSEIGRKRNAYRKAQWEYDAKMLEIESEVTRAISDMEGAAKEWLSAQKRLDAREISHRQSEKRFANGMISAIELQTNTNLLLEAQASLLNALYQYNIKSMVVKYYSGIPYADQLNDEK